MGKTLWNHCDQCGRIIAIDDFGRGAVRRLLTPSSSFTPEEWETLCKVHAPAPLSGDTP